MWYLDHKEGWTCKNWCFWTMVLEKILVSPLGSKEIKPVNPKVNQPWILNGRTDAEAEAPILWLPDVKNQLIGEDPDAGKDWRQEEKGTTEDKMVVWYQWLTGHEFAQAPGDADGQGSLVCCGLWGCKEPDMTEWLNNNNKYQIKTWHYCWQHLLVILFLLLRNRVFILCLRMRQHWYGSGESFMAGL